MADGISDLLAGPLILPDDEETRRGSGDTGLEGVRREPETGAGAAPEPETGAGAAPQPSPPPRDREPNDDGSDTPRAAPEAKDEKAPSSGKNDDVRILPIEDKNWVVELDCPPGVSPALRAFITGAQHAIQNAVDLLGRGTPAPPPRPERSPITFGPFEIGQGAIDPAYQNTANTARTRQESLIGMDDQVAETSVVVAGQQNSALRTIQGIVADLQSALASVRGTKLTPAKELALAEVVARAVELVYKQVSNTSDGNNQLAGNSGGGNGFGVGIPSAAGAGGNADGGTGGGAGGDAGGLGSMLPMLAMLPMAAMPLIGMVPDLLGKEDEETESEGESGETSAEAPPSATVDPGAGLVPVSGVVSSDNGQPALFPSLPTLGRSSASRRRDQEASRDDSSVEEDEDVVDLAPEEV